MKKVLSILGGIMFTTSSTVATVNTVSCDTNYTKEDFEKLVKKIADLDLTKYTTESVDNLMKVMIETATEVADGKNITENYNKLKKAMDSLVLKDNQTGEIKIYTLKDLFKSDIIVNDNTIKLIITYKNQNDYNHYTRNQSAFRWDLYYNISRYYKDIDLNIKRLIEKDFNSDKTELKTDLNLDLETRYEIKTALVSESAKAQINPTIWTIQYKIEIAS
ncbi:hypothetical protein [Spiroplasma diminutum]|uniref:Lipoprotein n=1 Tax=Spiroplasma diminutum CUAS-1 TaxID=1276221 RepID=S5MIX5_9MOLU|nr:hypothetical protein [Spiroplasma diminutum]AGR41890.1 hypothetical protein SDIMI_v3c01860 [Spiroplasma diminutum CUAS-1]